MREPKIRIGFIVFREGIEEEIKTSRGHWWAARDWVKRKNLEEEYQRVKEEGIIKDYDDFLMNYIGAIKLHAVSGVFKCYIPRGVPNQYKSFLKRFYRSRGYYIYGDVVLDKEHEIVYHNDYASYNQTIISIIHKDGSKQYVYNPLRNGD